MKTQSINCLKRYEPTNKSVLLYSVYASTNEAIRKLKLDRRHKWKEFYNSLIWDYKYSDTCTGCDGGGCHECGYNGNRIFYAPVPAFDQKNGNPIIIISLRK